MKFSHLCFWGRIHGSQADYYIVQGVEGIDWYNRRTLFSQVTGASFMGGGGVIVVNNVMYVIYNFEKSGLSKVLYAEKVIYFFSEIISIFLKLLFQN